MNTATQTDAITVEKFINAEQQVVFSYFTETDKIKAWYATDAQLDPRPGGVCNIDHEGQDASTMYHSVGEFIEVSPYSRVIYTWGYTDPDMGDLPQNGNSTVQVDFVPQDGGTLVRLAHSGLNANVREGFGDGNSTILDTLAEMFEKN
jgi:uncharacterized protein YndB with AHSA1/START domain